MYHDVIWLVAARVLVRRRRYGVIHYKYSFVSMSIYITLGDATEDVGGWTDGWTDGRTCLGMD